MRRSLRTYRLVILVIFLVSEGVACGKTDRRSERDLAYQTTCTLAHLFRTIGTEEETPKMRAYLEAATDARIADSAGRELFLSAFASGRQMQATTGFQRGWYSGESMMKVINLCAYYGFPECRAFAGQGPAEASAVFRALNELAECGKRLWTD